MPDQVTASLQRIQEKLGRLRTLDAGLRLFGAESHGYLLDRPLAEPDLKSFERQLRVTLPSGYRRFLAEVGHGGAGPYYGIFAIDGQDPENITE